MEEQPQAYQPYPLAPPRSRMPGWAWILIGCGCLMLLSPVFLAAILYPVFAQAREAARTTSCLSNVKQMSLGLLMYCQDYDERMPRGSDWMDVIGPYIKNETLYHCPTVGRQDSSSYGYAYNSALALKNLGDIAQPESTTLIFDSSNLLRNAADPVTSLPQPPRHHGRDLITHESGQGNNIGFLNGSAKFTLGGR